jgi:hypothetical protein
VPIFELQPPLVQQVLAEVVDGAEFPKLSSDVVAQPHHVRAMRVVVGSVTGILAAMATCAAKWSPESDKWSRLSAPAPLLYDMGFEVQQAVMMVLDTARRPSGTPFSPGQLFELGAVVLQRGPGTLLGASIILGQRSSRKGFCRGAVHVTPGRVITNFWTISGQAVLSAASSGQFPTSCWWDAPASNAVYLLGFKKVISKLPAYITA